MYCFEINVFFNVKNLQIIDLKNDVKDAVKVDLTVSEPKKTEPEKKEAVLTESAEKPAE